MEFSKEWEKGEILKIDKLDISSSQKFILQMLVFNLRFIHEKGINTLYDYEEEKKRICKDSNLVNLDAIKREVMRDLKNKKCP